MVQQILSCSVGAFTVLIDLQTQMFVSDAMYVHCLGAKQPEPKATR